MFNNKVFITFSLGLMLFMASSCGIGNPSPCDCARAEINGNNEVKKECEQYRETMTTSEQTDFNMKTVACIERL